ncbi:MAG TPA: Rieske (2Fe-2S) protein, partial [Chitinophagaceae bacterium]
MAFIKVCSFGELPNGSQKIVEVGVHKVALFHFNNEITAIGNACLHKAGPLGLGLVENKYDGTYVTCPWHGWEYNIKTGSAPPGYKDQQAVYEVKVEDNDILVSEQPVKKAHRELHDLKVIEDLVKLDYQTTPGSRNILGISTTNMNEALPRYSTSEAALELALDYAKEHHGASTKIIKLRDLGFRA